MKPGEIVKASLVGLKYYPSTFPISVWNQEFQNVDIDMFTRAVKKIRSTHAEFPTYSQVRQMMNTIRSDDNMNRSEYISTLSEKEKVYAVKSRGIFMKWQKWLKGHHHVTPKILLEYYNGCANEYLKLGGDSTFMAEVDGLFQNADRMQRRIDGLEDRFGNKREVI